MTFRPKVLAWLAASSLVLVGSVATAASDPVIDQKAGSLGRVIGIRIVTPGSRDHASYHGFVRTKPPLGDPETYGLDAAFPAAFVALLVPHVRDVAGRVAALVGALVAVVCVPLTPAGVPMLAAAAAVIPALWVARRAGAPVRAERS